MSHNSLANEFLNIMKIQLNRYCSAFNYYVFGDYVVSQLTPLNMYNLNLFIEIPRNSHNEEYEYFLQQLPYTTIDLFKLYNPDITIVTRPRPGYSKSIQFYLNSQEPLFCFNYVYDQYMSIRPFFDHELVSQDKYGNIILLDMDYPVREQKIFNLLKSIHQRKLLCYHPYSESGKILHHEDILHYLRSIKQKLSENWRIYEKANIVYQKECVICYDKMHREALVGLNCDHFFHINCFKQYIENDHETVHTSRVVGDRIKQTHKCPTCKQNITKLKIRYYVNSRYEQKSIL